MSDSNIPKIKVGISACLMGEKVRFDSGHKKNSYINSTLGDYFEFSSFCPEVDIGLGVPRQAIRLVSSDKGVRAVGSRTPELDVTELLYHSAENRREWHEELCGYILKKDSPSCGMERVKLYSSQMAERKGVGLYAARLMKNFPHLPVEEEGRLGDARLRENFIQRVYIYSRWRALNQEGLSLSKLQHFHARHKYIFMSHDQNKAKLLGNLLANGKSSDLSTLSLTYLAEMMSLLKKVASRSNHVNTLQHIQGYLKKQLTADDKQEMQACIEDYRKGLLPLIVPITLLRHHFRLSPDTYITESYYMQPHPGELMLLNNL
ncbi:DUF523 and DUF1722 domain-containing protein [uncultured Shewanella sp.]|uniref:YbgA family protein n=1 Tax=Shewanella atlantica TaxID=271099 RepID=UPI002605E006|nr:DUF523 and DUF1722 domain-containing protein [uncultured Shewanella sp.]